MTATMLHPRSTFLFLMGFGALVLTLSWPSVSSAQSQTGGAPLCDLSTNPYRTLGDSPGSEIGRLVDAVFVGDSLLAVADALGTTLTLLSVADGRTRTYGRRGAGPGEFRNLQRLALLADTLIAFDPTQRRASLFTFDRGFIRSVPAERGFVTLFAGDSMITVTSAAASQRGHDGPEVWVDTLYVRVHGGRQPNRVITRVADRTRIVDLTVGMNMIDAPYTAIPDVAVAAGTLFVADGSGHLLRFQGDGAELAPVQLPFARLAVTRSDLARWIEHSVAQARPSQQQVRRTLFQVADPPALAPAHGPLAVDRRQTVWAQEYRAPHDQAPWSLAVVDRHNHVVLTKMMPRRLRLLAASPAFVAFVETDDLDAEVVRVYSHSCSG